MEEPRFGEVWGWSDMGPFMVVGLTTNGSGSVYVDVVSWNDNDEGKMSQLVWSSTGSNYRKDWHRIDEGETV